MTDSIVDIVDALIEKLKLNAVELGLEDVWYGNQQNIPRTPSVTVIPETKSREMIETGHMSINTFRVSVTIWHSKFGAVGATRREADQLAERIEELLHQDPKLDGNVVYGYVSEMSPGFLGNRSGTIMQITRITWTGITKTRLF